MDRNREIVKASLMGIAGNGLLVVFKLIVGFGSHSIAIVLDGINNATDALSSIVTIIGMKLAGKKADRHHPFGYGRVEYLTSALIAVIILVAGLISLRESIEKIIHPGTPTYSVITISVIAVAIVAKIFIGIMFKRYGKKTECEALTASGIDSNYDAVLSAGTLVVAFAQNIWGVNIDGLVGLVISIVVCKAGIDVLMDALSPIIGIPEDRSLVADIRRTVSAHPEVLAAYDIVFDSFGPNKIIGSARIEVSDDMTACKIHELTRTIEKELDEQFGIQATIAIGVANTEGSFSKMRSYLEKNVNADNRVTDLHAFYVDVANRTCYFDLIADFNTDTEAIRRDFDGIMRSKFPRYTCDIQIDTDYQE